MVGSSRGCRVKPREKRERKVLGPPQGGAPTAPPFEAETPRRPPGDPPKDPTRRPPRRPDPSPLETERTDFDQSCFGHSDLTNLGQSIWIRCVCVCLHVGMCFLGGRKVFFLGYTKLFLAFSEVKGVSSIVELLLTFWKVKSGKAGAKAASSSSTQTGKAQQEAKQHKTETNQHLQPTTCNLQPEP